MAIATSQRDELTVERLVEAGSHLNGLRVLGFSREWWDGQARGPCLVVRGGRRSRRQRIVETGGECLIVPFARRRAQRWLADRRRPQRPELRLPDPRPAPDVIVLDASVDVVRCGTPSCGALIEVGTAGPCPVCGG